MGLDGLINMGQCFKNIDALLELIAIFAQGFAFFDPGHDHITDLHDHLNLGSTHDRDAIRETYLAVLVMHSLVLAGDTRRIVPAPSSNPC